MNGTLKLMAPFVAALAVAACNGGSPSTMPSVAGSAQGQSRYIPEWEANHTAVLACPGDRWHGKMQCDALISTKKISPNSVVEGLNPADFQSRYNLPSSTKGNGQLVAIVDAYDNPNVASDLSVYRTQWGLGTANFTKYNQTGQQGNYPPPNSGWTAEIDLDVEMVSASCPNCTIDLIEANTNNNSDLYAAVAEAVKLGAHIVSNSWGGGGAATSGNAFAASGVTYLAAAGDFGYGMEEPAAYQTVVSVGGTSLVKNGSVWSETVWSSTGGGCSIVSKPSWQHDSGCSKRTGNDVAAVASENVAFYDTYKSNGWGLIGGTSVATPLLAGVYGLAGNASTRQSGKYFWTLKKKKRKKDLHVISVGNDGSCGGSYLCTAGTGQFGTYSGPTGWGTPNGIGAF